MNGITIGTRPFTVTSSIRIISTDHALVELLPGCTWLPLKKDNQNVGIAFKGPFRLMVDTIVDTARGAIGRSLSYNLDQTSVYLGRADPSAVSRPSTDDETESAGEGNSETFHERMRNSVEEILSRSVKELKVLEGRDILLGEGKGRKQIVLICRGSDMLFSYEGTAYIHAGGTSALVDGSVVTLNRHGGGYALSHIDRHGILNLLFKLP
ncbi:MAG: hypothetical protein QXS20_05095 [Candidatus Thorarchaeota archaeon]